MGYDSSYHSNLIIFGFCAILCLFASWITISNCILELLLFCKVKKTKRYANKTYCDRQKCIMTSPDRGRNVSDATLRATSKESSAMISTATSHPGMKPPSEIELTINLSGHVKTTNTSTVGCVAIENLNMNMINTNEKTIVEIKSTSNRSHDDKHRIVGQHASNTVDGTNNDSSSSLHALSLSPKVSIMEIQDMLKHIGNEFSRTKTHTIGTNQTKSTNLSIQTSHNDRIKYHNGSPSHVHSFTQSEIKREKTMSVHDHYKKMFSIRDRESLQHLLYNNNFKEFYYIGQTWNLCPTFAKSRRATDFHQKSR